MTQTKQYVIPQSAVRDGITTPVQAVVTTCPGLLITPMQYANGQTRRGEFAITHEATGKAIALWLPSVADARKIVAALGAINVGWESSEATIYKQFSQLDPALCIWLWSLLSDGGDSIQ